MAEIRETPWNGLTVASTFSGAGGSSLGYRMAGYRVLYANEFVELARDTYRANAGDHTVIDDSDIRELAPEDILSVIGLDAGELDLLDGSPPCASFSTAGKRHKYWGQAKEYSDTAQRTDDLFFEFARILNGIQPKTFVAENVSGLVKGTAKGYFKEILVALRACGYRVSAKLLSAQWLGVPQMRQRLIFVGMRNDLGIDPVHPRPLPYYYSALEAIADVENSDAALKEVDLAQYKIGNWWHRIRPGEAAVDRFNLIKPRINGPSPTLTATADVGAAAVCHPLEPRKFTIAELRRLASFPDDFILTGNYRQQAERIGRAVPPVMMSHIAGAIRDRVRVRATPSSPPSA